MHEGRRARQADVKTFLGHVVFYLVSWDAVCRVGKKNRSRV